MKLYNIYNTRHYSVINQWSKVFRTKKTFMNVKRPEFRQRYQFPQSPITCEQLI